MLWVDQCHGKPGICSEIKDWRLSNGKYFGQTLYGTYLLNVSFTGESNIFAGNLLANIYDQITQKSPPFPTRF